jgi:hypothetical protein
MSTERLTDAAKLARFHPVVNPAKGSGNEDGIASIAWWVPHLTKRETTALNRNTF